MHISTHDRLMPSDKLVPGNFDLLPEDLGLTKKQDGIYTISQDFLFEAKRKETGQYIWKSFKPINARHVSVIVKIAAQFNQSVHINTGTHGSGNGDTVLVNGKYGETVFFEEDIEIAKKVKNVSIHNISSQSPPIYPSKANHVIDAWCYSQQTDGKRVPVLTLIGKCSKHNHKNYHEIGIQSKDSYNIIQEKARAPGFCSTDGSHIKYKEIMVGNVRHVIKFMKSKSKQEISIKENNYPERESYTYLMNERYKYYQITI